MGWIDEVQSSGPIEHGTGLDVDELRRLFPARGGPVALGSPPPATLTGGPKLTDLLAWARDENPAVTINVEQRRHGLRVTTPRGEYVVDRRADEDWIDTFRRAGLLGRS